MLLCQKRGGSTEMKNYPGFILCIILSFVFQANAESSGGNLPADFRICAVRLNETPAIDGVLAEPVWNNMQGTSRFVMRDPTEGGQPSESTMVWVAYDNEALYIAARMFDSSPKSIVARLGRKDVDMNSDAFIVFLDPYHDKRSGYYFAVNAAGTYYDGVLMNDDWDDDSWDGVWQAVTKIDDKGWTAEFRIPFSQLRFQNRDKHVWGINFRRDIQRKNERDYIVFTPKDGSGFVSRFVDLVGIESINPPHHLEILPYVRTRAEYLHPEAGDPFNDGSSYSPDMGMDLKYGIGSNLTLDMTVNPDFGQVEVDPAVVNLSDVETFFEEKRPFFIEGASIFDFGSGGSSSNWSFNWSNPDFFYSRRIGRAPQGELPDYDFASIPQGAHISGAAKITGKIRNNWNIGTVHAVTRREMARYAVNGQRFRSEVEPLSYYGIFRAQKEINNGRQALGVLSSYAARNFREESLRNDINQSAFSFGMDGWTFLDKSKVWVVTGWGGFSDVRGNHARMVELQRSSRHYFQRPDARYFSVDSSTNHLRGYAGRLSLNKQKGNVILNSAFGVISPGFDINDVGFLWRADLINAHLGGGYKWTKPGKIFRYAELLGAVFQTYDFDGNNLWRGVWQHGYFEFLNYYQLYYSLAYNPVTYSNTFTRGGPLVRIPAGWERELFLETDHRKTWVFVSGTYGYYRSPQEYNNMISASVEWKPRSNLSIQVGPEMVWNHEFAQWVDSFEDPYAINTFGNRYVFANMNQRELKANIRVNWTFSPRLSFQLYAQPLISSGNYYNYKGLAYPRTYDFNAFSGNNVKLADDTYTIDPDGGGPSRSFEFDNPDFNFRSLRGNAVLRWEYRPGSTLFLVWTQNRSESVVDGAFAFNRSVERLWNAAADNIFLLKWTYWWNL
ncbi:MAG: DUF5916 domain-containing protein [Calditrichia bacterium]